jgi:hypothetical protein
MPADYISDGFDDDTVMASVSTLSNKIPTPPTEGASNDFYSSNRSAMPADYISDGFDDDTVMASVSTLSKNIPTPPTHHHDIRKIHRRDRVTPNALAFLDCEAAVDDAGNEEGGDGSETDNSIEGTIDSGNLLIVQLETCGQASSQVTETIRTTSPCPRTHLLVRGLAQQWPIQPPLLAAARRRSPTLQLIALHALKKLRTP